MSSVVVVDAAGQLRPLRPLRVRSDPFTLGVASGDPHPDSVMLRTRLVPRPLQPDGGMGPQPVDDRLAGQRHTVDAADRRGRQLPDASGSRPRRACRRRRAASGGRLLVPLSVRTVAQPDCPNENGTRSGSARGSAVLGDGVVPAVGGRSLHSPPPPGRRGGRRGVVPRRLHLRAADRVIGAEPLDELGEGAGRRGDNVGGLPACSTGCTSAIPTCRRPITRPRGWSRATITRSRTTTPDRSPPRARSPASLSVVRSSP